MPEWLHKPSDWLTSCLTARDRRTINFWLLIVWLLPGALIWYVLRDALWFVGFMSIYAIWISHWTAVAAETPVETEDE